MPKMSKQSWYEYAKSLGAHPIHAEREIQDEDISVLEYIDEQMSLEEDEGLRREILNDRRMEKDDTRPMSETTDYRHELKLRDESLRRELDLRQESFRAEQAVRDKALDAKFADFFSAQAARDKAFEKLSEERFERIEKDVASIKSDAKKVSEDVQGIKVTMAKYLGGAIVIGAIASALLGAALRFLVQS